MTPRRRKKKKNNFLKILLVVLLLGSAYFFVSKNSAESSIAVPERITIADSSASLWWNNEYSYRRKIDVNKYEKGIIEINHAQLSIENKSNIDGSDLKILGLSEGNYTELPFDYEQFDSISTKLAFDPGIFKYNEYYLYYGNKGEIGNMNTSSSKQILSAIKNFFTMREEEKPAVQISTLKKWVLKDSDEIKNLNIRVNSDLNLNNARIVYVIDEDSRQFETEFSNNSVLVDFSQLNSGTHSVFLVVNLGGEVYRTNSIVLKVSEPIYVAWTLDWEGIDPNQVYLDKIADLTSDFNIKTTHFFNPRILINIKIDSNRKKQIVNWVKDRYENNGDEIAMHLHMHHDMVEEAGVKAKYNARTWDKGSSGYDTPSTEYSYEEYLKILKWGISKIDEAGLPKPIGYRAGGWFANLETLRATQDAGFQYDSSARISQAIGQNMLVQTWEITSKTQPYKISKIDQNTNIIPTMDLMEIPNNGLDSYWSEASDMIQNFYDNYTPGTAAEHSRLITFLSHPEWFYVDEPKLRELFTELNKYRIDFDNGPVKFVTLKEWMEINQDESVIMNDK